QGKAFLMCDKFNSLLPAEFANRQFRADKLKHNLQKYYGDRIVIQPQRGQGKSSIVLSSAITLGDAIRAATNMKQELKATQVELDTSFDTIQ
ncbi:MAG: hypothetical protein ABW185_00010, partial [Sedimenticola sp.]